MLRNDLYTLDTIEDNEGIITAKILLNENHSIFDGHFPEQPVLPGVCTLEILKELIQDSMNRSFVLEEANNIKFLSLVDPRKSPGMTFEFKYEEVEGKLKVSASAKVDDDIVSFKIKGVFA
ncbi:3-hydroxyacyl-ACP dehydratase [Marinigracilibium pacificum]|uniref:3-hydroxyacyl-ACP dehydratase n=1 Tax=Marinigracilibium pacificum TaxID=2729599 RepID=A0A848J3X7_9BACT|nr:3-hydroxyacyl-ACP dehydratase [Marinigracilibium pacificum]NMM47882.1 3-hydroxyacyl-ACP dehydratase [Marinigracilibium pacificum]